LKKRRAQLHLLANICLQNDTRLIHLVAELGRERLFELAWLGMNFAIALRLDHPPFIPLRLLVSQNLTLL
jgi:hypothetical protein